MKFFLAICFSTTVFFSAKTPVYSQQLIQVNPKGPVICYQSNKNEPDRIDAPEKFRQWRATRSARSKTATIEVEYVNFPADNQAKTAFQFAVDIWETELKSTVPIKIRAQWGSLASGVLGQAIWGTAFANFDGAQHINTFYPVALAEKMAGRELNPSGDPDIVATFNSNAQWYFGIEGEAPAGKMDLVTIVLHEIAHGLGFTDTYDVDNGQGSVGLENGGVAVPFVFDLFVENGSGKKLFSEFLSPSTELNAQLTGNGLFFNTPLSVAATGTRPKIYAPNPFDDGSSIAHLNEATFTTPGDANKLMTPQIAFMETIHDPGSIVRGMFSDMGWVFTRIEHEPLTDTERMDGQPYIVKAHIVSDNGYDPDEVKLHYTTDNINFTVLTMTATGNPDEFESSLPGTTSDKTYGYFISVVDVINRTFTNPGKIQEQNKAAVQDIIVVDIKLDTEKPEIVHTPVEFIFEEETQIEISAIITDNIGVDEASVEYSVNDGALQIIPMLAGADDTYTATLILPPALEIGNKIEYRIKATDNSSGANVATHPETDFHTVLVTGIMPVQDSYINDFNEPTTDFAGNSFSITAPAGFDNGAIHSKHTYDNGSEPNDESNYIYQLQIPVRIDETNPFIQFDEIVLVEPGENGSTFGDADFFDYAVVEGSKDEGTTWIPFADGYDSRDYTAWLNRYNSNISNNNSQAAGDPSLFRERTINMTQSGDFAEDDEVLIRFRLFADQAAHGWGWAIDNLSVQGPGTITGVEHPQDSDLKVYPIPAREIIHVELRGVPSGKADLQIINLQGQSLYQKQIDDLRNVHESVDVSPLPEGLYFLRVNVNGRQLTRKFLIAN